MVTREDKGLRRFTVEREREGRVKKIDLEEVRDRF